MKNSSAVHKSYQFYILYILYHRPVAVCNFTRICVDIILASFIGNLHLIALPCYNICLSTLLLDCWKNKPKAMPEY